jgi:hypothetical protein
LSVAGSTATIGEAGCGSGQIRAVASWLALTAAVPSARKATPFYILLVTLQHDGRAAGERP